MNKYFLRNTFIILIIFLTLFVGYVVHAQVRSYSYDLIDQQIQINKDSTVDITEREKFNFIGEYHKGYRSISKQKISAITDVFVTDAETGQVLTRVSHALEKTDPQSWGHYYVSDTTNTTDVEWYYNAKDTIHEWVIHYRVHGAIGFFQDHDELYWNLFTDFDVPVSNATATVFLPEGINEQKLQIDSYATNPNSIIETHVANGHKYDFVFNNIAPKDAVTIAAGFPKGIVLKSAFFFDFLKTYWIILTSILLIIVILIWRLLFWYFKEKKLEEERTIVVEYAPPGNIRPAMASLITYERINSKVWSSTVVDLAVRGYVRVEEEILPVMRRFGNGIIPFILIIVVFALFMSSFITLGPGNFPILGIIFTGLVGLLLLKSKGLSRSIFNKISYKLIRTEKEYGGELEDYEKEFLDIFFNSDVKEFSFLAMQKAPDMEKRRLYKEIQELEKSLAIETNTDTHGYEISIGRLIENKRNIFSFGLLAFILIIKLIDPVFGLSIALASGSIIFAFWVVYEAQHNPRLNTDGRELKRKLLGFKLYLETAERYRLQNLTPETFEKYLPYAMLFGVEKKWARAFTTVSLPSPSWYSGTYTNGLAGSTNSGGFSAFAAGFSTSFSSAFASSGGGGSGGGGGAGGGGGGGGGGAS